MASNSRNSSLGSSAWSREQNRQFEAAIIMYDKDSPNRWHNIARLVDGKSAEDVRRYYDDLLKDIMHIETDQVPIPNYRTITSNGRAYVTEHRTFLKNLKLH